MCIEGEYILISVTLYLCELYVTGWSVVESYATDIYVPLLVVTQLLD